MRAEQILDHAIMHLVEQNRQSMSMYGKCMYNGPNGLHCAIGWVQPDAPFKENVPASDNIPLLLMRGVISEEQAHSQEFSEWLDMVQRAHDWVNNFPVTTYAERFQQDLERLRKEARYLDKLLMEL